MADTIREWLVGKYPPNKKCESPIEALFYSALEFMKAHNNFVLQDQFRIEQQVVIGDYRADFLFNIRDEQGRNRRVVVELDGHDFHERTKEQAARDKARDRFMLCEGVEVMRFAGTEVWANPFACVEEVTRRCYVLRYGCTEAQAAGRAVMAEMKAYFEMP